MNYYGKKQEELTKDEQKLLSKDMLLIQSFMMKMDGQMLIGGNPNHPLHLGTQEDVDTRTVDREMFAGVKLLGLKKPKTQKAFDKMSEKVEESQYGYYKFVDDYAKQWSQRKPRIISVTVMG